MTNENHTQDTRQRNARQQLVHDYAEMPARQIDYGHGKWDETVEVDGDELARIRAEQRPNLEQVRPAPFDQDDTEPEYKPVDTKFIHQSTRLSLEQPESRFERYTFMENSRPDWAQGGFLDIWAVVEVTGIGGTVEVNADHPDELRVVAGFFMNAADELEKTQQSVRAVRAGDNG